MICLFLTIPVETTSHIKVAQDDIHIFKVLPQPKKIVRVEVNKVKKKREQFDFIKIHLHSNRAAKEFQKKVLSNKRIQHYVKSNHFNGHVERCLKIAKKMKYFEYIVPIFNRYNIPKTFTLLPVIESCFDPQAVSHAKAVGMWQINRITARHLDMKIKRTDGGWTEDERYNWKRSTKAAAEYILFLKARFPTWELVLAAYNWGPTNLRERIRKYKTRNIDYLKLPKETRNYVYKFVAMTEIIKKEKL